MTDPAVEQICQTIQVDLEQRYPPGTKARRCQHPDGFALAAEFDVHEDIPGWAQHSVFAIPGRHKAVVRFSMADPNSDPDRQRWDAVGMAIKIYADEVGGSGSAVGLEPLAGSRSESEGGDPATDLHLATGRAFFAGLPEDCAELAYRMAAGQMPRYFLPSWRASSWRLRELANAMIATHQGVASPLQMTVHSQVAYRLGDEIVKYACRTVGRRWRWPRKWSPNDLRRAVEAQLTQGHATMVFAAQKGPGTALLPGGTEEWLDPRYRWSRRRFPFVELARIRFLQGTDVVDGDGLVFRPQGMLGPIGEVREAAYEVSANYRAQ